MFFFCLPLFTSRWPGVALVEEKITHNRVIYRPATSHSGMEAKRVVFVRKLVSLSFFIC